MINFIKIYFVFLFSYSFYLNIMGNELRSIFFAIISLIFIEIINRLEQN